jgi:hypothetical protein
MGDEEDEADAEDVEADIVRYRCFGEWQGEVSDYSQVIRLNQSST